MKRYIYPAILLSVFFLAGRFWSDRGIPAMGQGSGGACSGNGDVNGDGKRDISDAIYLLSWLFTGGNEPVACADGGGLTPEQAEILRHMSIANLDDGSGHQLKTICFTGVNVQIVNGLGATNGQPLDEYDPDHVTTNGLGNLIIGYQEKRTGPRESNDRTGSHNLIVGPFQNYSSCGGFVAGLHNDLSGLSASVSGGMWNSASGQTSSVSGGVSNQASGNWASVCGGRANTADKPDEILGDSLTKPRFVDNGDGTVTDKGTGLMWQKATDPIRRTISDAYVYCEDLDFAGHKDWRMPNLEELLSIVIETRNNPAIDPIFEAESTQYWATAFGFDHPMGVDFTAGLIIIFMDDDARNLVRAVRLGP